MHAARRRSFAHDGTILELFALGVLWSLRTLVCHLRGCTGVGGGGLEYRGHIQ